MTTMSTPLTQLRTDVLNDEEQAIVREQSEIYLDVKVLGIYTQVAFNTNTLRERMHKPFVITSSLKRSYTVRLVSEKSSVEFVVLVQPYKPGVFPRDFHQMRLVRRDDSSIAFKVGWGDSRH